MSDRQDDKRRKADDTEDPTAREPSRSHHGHTLHRAGHQPADPASHAYDGPAARKRPKPGGEAR